MAAKKKEIRMEGAPYWYGTPMKDLDFEWDKEELRMIERYCEKILKNVGEEDMLPVDRWKAHMYAKPGEKNADRKLCSSGICPPYYTRTMDSYADALKPIDLFSYPKLLVMASLATVARFKMDYVCWANISYTEELWGGQAKMIDYGNPCPMGTPPIKTFEDLERTPVPDPYSDGLFPGYLWANREMRRFHDKYKLPLAYWTSCCPGATEVVQLGMMGWTGFQVNLAKKPDLVKAAAWKANEWCKAFGRAMIDVAHPEGIYYCQFTGGFPIRGANEWVADTWVELGKDLKDYSMKKSKHKIPGHPDGWIHLSHGYSVLSGIMEWYDVLNKHGALTPEMFDGGMDGDTEAQNANAKEIIAWHKEHNIYVSTSILNKTLEEGPISAIEEAITALSKLGYSHRKFSQNVWPIYFCPPAHYDAAMAAAKKADKL